MLLLTPQKIWKPNKGTSIHGQCQVGLQAGITKTLRCRETHDRAKGLSWRNRWTLIMQPCLKDLKHQSLETRLQLHGWTHLNELSFTSEPNTGVIFKTVFFIFDRTHSPSERRKMSTFTVDRPCYGGQWHLPLDEGGWESLGDLPLRLAAAQPRHPSPIWVPRLCIMWRQSSPPCTTLRNPLTNNGLAT